jgi:membrane protein DedA with SNARE-associated domain
MNLGAFIEQLWHAVQTGQLPDLGNWSYVILIVLVFIEGPVATLAAATMAASGILRADLVFLFSMIANFMADVFWYLLGYFGGSRRLLLRIGWVRRRWFTIRRIQRDLRNRAAKLYLLTKLSMGLLTIPILIAAGMSRVPWLHLAAVGLIIEPLWNGLLVFAGLHLGKYVAQLEQGLQVWALVGTVAIFFILLTAYRRMFARIAHTMGVDLRETPPPESSRREPSSPA